MTDLAGILMLEHVAIRNISICTKSGEPDFAEFHSYLRNCHIEIEEKLVFPLVLASASKGEKELVSRIEHIRADHKLIETLAGNLGKWKETGNKQLYGDRLPLYYRLLVDHNRNEDETVFPIWKEVDGNEARKAAKEALSIIESYGTGRYLEVIGIPRKAMDYLFGKI